MNAFWLAPIPPYSYALLRIALGGLGCITLFGLVDVGQFWDPAGVVPLADPLGLKAAVTAWRVNSISGWMFFAATFAAFAVMTLGYRARTATLIALILSLFQTIWNYLPLSGADAAMRCMLFCLVWADTAAVWSVDAWLRRRAGLSAESTSPSPIGPLLLIRFQIALIYLNSGLWKLLNPLWRDGSALHYVLSSNVYARFPAALPPWTEPLLTVATYITLGWELAFAFLVLWRPTRTVALAIGIAIHLGIWITLEIGLFSFVMIAGYAAYLDPASLRDLPHRLMRRSPSPRYAEVPTT
jgi:hypothetical protein